MNILFYCPSKFNINSSFIDKLGGIETLNYELSKELSKKNNINIYLATICNKIIKNKRLTNLPIKDLVKNEYIFDVIISSNNPIIFNKYLNSKKILWLHNTLALEKALRKKVLFSILTNKINVLFVSKYLNQITSKLYFFKKRNILPNFLPTKFENQKKNYIRKKIFIWSVQRDKGLSNVLNIWTKEIFPKNNDAKLYIFGINKKSYNKKISEYRRQNIFFYGRVSKNHLRNTYKKSLAMICLGYDETFCLNALEANSCGLPIITFGKTALKSFTINGKNGYLVDNYNDLAKKIKFLCNSKLNPKIIKYCYEYSEKFYLKRISSKWLRLIRAL